MSMGNIKCQNNIRVFIVWNETYNNFFFSKFISILFHIILEVDLKSKAAEMKKFNKKFLYIFFWDL